MIKKYDYLICTESLYNGGINGVCLYIKGNKYQFYGISNFPGVDEKYFMVPEKDTTQFKYHRISKNSFNKYFCSINENRKRKLQKLTNE